MAKISLRETIRQIMAEHLNKNNGLLFGECVSDPSGVAGTIPENKNVIDLPMTELGGADIAVGSALAGRRPIFVVRFQDFMLMNGSPFIFFAAVVKEMHNLTAPVFIRALANDHFDATHSNVLHSLFMHFSGIKVAAPCTPEEYWQVWKSFLSDDVPYYISEFRDTFDNTEEMEDITVADADINIWGISICRQRIFDAIKILNKFGIKANIFNIVWLKPFDVEKYLPYLKAVPRGLVVDSGREICGACEAFAYRLMKLLPGAYVDVLGVKDKIKTTNPNCYNEIPTVEMIISKVQKLLSSE